MSGTGHEGGIAGMRRIAQEKGYAPAVRAGGLLFVAGQAGRTADLQVIDDPESQFAACFENLPLVLDAAGCGFDDIVDLAPIRERDGGPSSA